MSAVGGFVAGAIGGAVAGDVYEKAKDAIKDTTGDNSHGELSTAEQMMVHLLSRIESAVRKDQSEHAPDVTQPVFLNNNSTIDFNRRGYKHCWMLCSSSFKLNYFTAAGKILYTTAVGWNYFDLPMKTQLQIDPTDVATVEVILYYSNDDHSLPGLAS